MKFKSAQDRPSNWTELKLVEVCKTFTSGGTPSRKKSEYFADGTIPWVKTKELNDGLVTEAEEWITQEALDNSSAKLLPKDTVLLAMYGATVGKLGVLAFESACNQACAALVLEDGVADYRFIYYLLMNHRKAIVAQATGGAQQNLSGDAIKNFIFDFPSFQEQTVIADSLWMLDRKIQINKELSKTLEDIAQTIFKSWFIDFDPVKAKMAGEKPVGMDDATAELFPNSMEDSELGLIPSGWFAGNLADVFSLQGGYSFKSSSWAERGVPVVKIGSVKPGLVDLNQVSYISQELAANVSSSFKLESGSLVIGLTGYVGQVGLVRTHFPAPLLNQRVARFGGVDGEWRVPFTYCLTRRLEFKKAVENAAIGSAQQNVSIAQILGLPHAVPPFAARAQFDDLFENSFRKIIALADENEILGQLRDALLPRLISGELQIPEEMLAS